MQLAFGFFSLAILENNNYKLVLVVVPTPSSFA